MLHQKFRTARRGLPVGDAHYSKNSCNEKALHKPTPPINEVGKLPALGELCYLP